MKTAHCDFSAYVHIQSLFVCVLCCEWGGCGRGKGLWGMSMGAEDRGCGLLWKGL